LAVAEKTAEITIEKLCNRDEEVNGDLRPPLLGDGKHEPLERFVFRVDARPDLPLHNDQIKNKSSPAQSATQPFGNFDDRYPPFR